MSKNILVVESDNDSLALLKEILEEKGCTVFGTIYAENAFDILGQGIKIDIIMVSTYFANSEELSVVKRFKEKEQYATIPIIGIVQSAQTSEGSHALKEGCSSILVKPIDEEGIENVLKGFEI